ncbi:hypothetical protein CPB84DRAFT_1957822 [Gymnopilus junonius]|uniref:Uncharacterized protein n=1 Tax=Gymnopilus junonius TaxID=109634 RepID=A0A9P5P186_GYMJU|nr:hypothetical protein CPB84DRAFT_1957822 [Gymnopilus junonius]
MIASSSSSTTATSSTPDATTATTTTASQQQQPPPPPQPEYIGPELTPEEILRRDRVRAAARERQRKHRLLVKQRRMRELGMEMGNDIMPGMEEIHYRSAPDGAPLGGQTFASTLLLSFSCAPLLKQHLLRTLGMSNEELASLEPVIAEAWDRWDHQRRMHYAEQVAKNGGQPPALPPYPVEMNQQGGQGLPPPPPPFPHPNGPGPADPAGSDLNFRARFHRSIEVPTPFSQTASTTTPSSGSGSTAPAEAIDPHLSNAGSSSNNNDSTNSTIKSETSNSLFDELLTPGSTSTG